MNVGCLLHHYRKGIESMRTIERAMAAAIRAGKSFSGGNTRVTPTDGGGFVVTLHGNTIATAASRCPDGTLCGVALYHAGWKTATTKSRLNAILFAIGEPKTIGQRRGEWRVFDYSTGASFSFDGALILAAVAPAAIV